MSNNLEISRKKIRELDRKILILINERLNVAERIGDTKKKSNLSPINLKVEKSVLDNSLQISKTIGLSEEFSKKIINILISQSLKVQGITSEGRSKYLYGVFEKAKEMTSKGEKLIRLEIGEPNFLCPPSVKEAARKALTTNEKIGYVSAAGTKELREAVANKVNQTHKLEISPNQILITPGGKFGVFAGILTTVSEVNRLLLIEPYWPVYEECAILARTRIDRIHTVLDNSWKIDLEKIKEAFNAGTKLLILCNPSNPTGNIIPEDELKSIVELANDNNVTILADEVYDVYAFKPFKSILETSCNDFIYIQSFSKRYGMTGWRVGYAISSPTTIKKMQKMMQISATCVPEFVQKAAIKALETDDATLTKFSKTMKKRVEIASKELDDSPLSYKKPDGGMYIFPRVNIEKFNSQDFALKLLAEQKVAVSPGQAFGDYTRYFRISLGGSEEDIKEGIHRIVKMIEKWQDG
ncbi:aminotransferase class I/II-fold pyridoxal phosphate-dependent enzyme [Candidatus Bathyarchaeota archaeon]|nr:aminotransferase class I/II-fold pyridoxal phosphate-dependent enzyme [Candidatus Bathyarchaeota archaeon]